MANRGGTDRVHLVVDCVVNDWVSSLLDQGEDREQRGKLVRLNRALIPSVFGGTARAHAYSWLDRSALHASGSLRYRLQAVSLDGMRSWLGSAVATAR